MGFMKVTKDRLVRSLLGQASVPRGLFELLNYFRIHGPINFQYHHEDGLMVAVSTNFRYGSIVAQGRDLAELDQDIKDAILTAFEVPSSYAKEARIVKEGEESHSYALA